VHDDASNPDGDDLTSIGRGTPVELVVDPGRPGHVDDAVTTGTLHDVRHSRAPRQSRNARHSVSREFSVYLAAADRKGTLPERSRQATANAERERPTTRSAPDRNGG
jgi:hypothetical protein